MNLFVLIISFFLVVQRCVLDSSSFALASAAVVIICISRDFKTDPKCRLEALKVEKLHKSSLKSTESADSHKIAGNPDGVTRSPSYSIDATNCLQHVLFVYTQADYTLATVPEHCDGWLEGLLLRYQQRNRNGNNNGRRSRTNSFDDNDNHRTPRSARSNNSSQNTSLSTVGMRATKLRNNGEIPGFPLWDADCIDSTTRIIVDIIGDCGKVVDIEEKSDVSEAMNTKVDTASNDHHKNSPVNIADEIPREDFAKSLPSESITLKSPIPIDIGENSGSSITSKESLASPYVGTHSSPINGQLDRTNGLPVRATSEDQPIDSRMQSTPTAIGLQSTDNLVRPSSRDKTHLLHDVSAPLLSYEYADDRPVQSKYKARGSSAGSRRGSESSAGSRPEIEKLLGEESSAHRALTTSEIDYNNAWVALHSESKVTDLSKVNQKLNDYGVMEAAELAELDKEDIEQLATLFKKAQRRKFLMIFHM